MSYAEFLEKIDNYVGKVVEFTSKRKFDGYICTFQRYVWDGKEFGALKDDAPMEILNVRIVRNGHLNRSTTGVISVQ